jgi:hypothetical protein
MALSADARFTVHPQKALTMVRADTYVPDVPLARVLATRKTLDKQSLISGLRVEVMTYRADDATCPVIDRDSDAGGCASLLISAWVDLADNTRYALWHVAAPRAMWTLAPTEPKRVTSGTDYERLLLACEPPPNIRDQTLQLDDVLMHGVPYRLRIRARLVPHAPVEYEATLERVADDVFGGKKYSCIGQPIE